ELHIPSIDLRKFKSDDRLVDVIPERLARQHRFVPLSMMGDTLTVALVDPLNIAAIDDIRDITGKNVDVVMGSPVQIEEAISRLYGTPQEGSVADVSKTIDVGDFEIISEGKAAAPDAEVGDQAPVIRMVNLIIKEALRQRASDIHLDPSEKDMRVRYRVDGVLEDVLEIPRESRGAVVVRIKIMSRLDITTTQTPQDGRFKMRLGAKEVDFRVSILPTSHGPKVVMRILDRSNLSVGLAHLGFSPRSIQILDEAIQRPFGMLLVTGPTGSGKSTTLYSIVNQLNSVDRNIITVEDPVEYLVEGVTQIEVRSDIGLSFASSLRSILRQSPDVVMVGEIRDNETADIAIKASLTGQLVLSTLHTNDAAGAVTRLVDMDVEPFLVASSLILVCAQRLCRKICPHCKEPVDIPEEALRRFQGKVPPGTKLYAGRGCDRCRQTGYLGRFGVTEILLLDDGIRELLLEGRSADDIKEYAVKNQGMRTLWDDAIDHLTEGLTTFEEVLRVAAED
ncbi:MAG: Flp pilus assembly complex ATPase component TadA, partial [Elusimicrobia bacterium]|nr:Flp pilus assembly complex ATPase component TadA [Elusimicrobiota bacterium]